MSVTDAEILNSLVVPEALDSLSQTHAEVLRLARGEGLPQSQIAKRLSLPLGTVKTRSVWICRIWGTLAEPLG